MYYKTYYGLIVRENLHDIGEMAKAIKASLTMLRQQTRIGVGRRETIENTNIGTEFQIVLLT